MKSFKIVVSLLMALLLSVGVVSVAFADGTSTSVTETEPNNDKDNATVIGVGIDGIGKILDENDKDYFKVAVANAGLATVTVGQSAGGTSYPYYEVSVVDKDDNALCKFTVKGDEKTTVSPKFPVSVDDYYILVEAGSVVVDKDYSVNLEIATGAKAEAEPNNDFSNATDISYNNGISDKYYGTIASSTDVDWYKFVCQKGYFYVDLYNSNGVTGDYKVTVYAGVGTLYTPKEIGEFILTASESEGSTCAISVGLGTYYAKVEGVNGSTGGYQIQIESKYNDNSEAEYNSEKDYANAITIGSKIYGNISFAGDLDYFYIDQKTIAEDKRYYEFKFEPGKVTNKSTTSWIVTLYKKDGSVITTLSATDTAAVTFLLEDVDTDTVIVEVKAGSTYGSGNYIITITQKEKPASKMTFKERFKAIDWKSLWNDNFASWIGNVEVKAMLKTMLASFKNVFRALLANRG